MTPREWNWKSLRSFGVSVGFWPFEWSLSIEQWDDQYGGCVMAALGPIEFTFSYNDGSALRGPSG